MVKEKNEDQWCKHEQERVPREEIRLHSNSSMILKKNANELSSRLRNYMRTQAVTASLTSPLIHELTCEHDLLWKIHRRNSLNRET